MNAHTTEAGDSPLSSTSKPCPSFMQLHIFALVGGAITKTDAADSDSGLKINLSLHLEPE